MRDLACQFQFWCNLACPMTSSTIISTIRLGSHLWILKLMSNASHLLYTKAQHHPTIFFSTFKWIFYRSYFLYSYYFYYSPIFQFAQVKSLLRYLIILYFLTIISPYASLKFRQSKIYSFTKVRTFHQFAA